MKGNCLHDVDGARLANSSLQKGTIEQIAAISALTSTLISAAKQSELRHERDPAT